ncbi:hypothetical protein SAY86_011760 [Trapa natans]|uniref:Uncharacterized protein n=1 Tax=Trapa natans TaxID=22666 RepID=A0AAN7LXI6_TRANT|nr:hypothetical protein SAY86_011760 [Trapa natans]
MSHLSSSLYVHRTLSCTKSKPPGRQTQRRVKQSNEDAAVSCPVPLFVYVSVSIAEGVEEAPDLLIIIRAKLHVISPWRSHEYPRERKRIPSHNRHQQQHCLFKEYDH